MALLNVNVMMDILVQVRSALISMNVKVVIISATQMPIVSISLEHMGRDFKKVTFTLQNSTILNPIKVAFVKLDIKVTEIFALMSMNVIWISRMIRCLLQ